MKSLFSAMNTPRRRLALALAIVLLAAAGLWWVRTRASVLRALPPHVAMALRLDAVTAMDHLPTETRSVLHKLEPVGVFNKDWQLLEQLLRRDSALSQQVQKADVAAAWTLLPSDSLHPLIAITLRNAPDFERFFAETDPGYKVFPTTFRGHTLYKINQRDGQTFAIAAHRGLLLTSRFAHLVEDALTELDRYALKTAIKPPSKHERRAPVALWMRPGETLSWLCGTLAPGWRELPEQASEALPWIGFAFTADGNRFSIQANGFWVDAAAWLNPPSEDLYTVLPNHTAVLAYAGITRLQKFFSGPAPSGYQPFDQYFLPWLGKEVAYVVTEPLSAGWTEDQFLVLEARDTALARRLLLEYGRANGLVRAPEAYQTFELFEFFNSAVLTPVTGKNPGFKSPVAALLGRYVVIGESRTALELWIDKYIVSQTLVADPAFLQLLEKRRPAPWIYVNSHYLPVLAKTLSGPGNHSAAQDTRTLSALGRIAFSIIPAGGKITGYMTAQPDAQPAPGEVNLHWKTPLAADALTAPDVVVLPGSRDAGAVFVQDKRFELYCINGNGEVRWRRLLPKALIGPVQGFDLFGTGAPCYLFNTAEAVWLVDEQGRDLDGFPLKLQSPATNGVALVNFDNRGEYAFFIACANGNMYGYDPVGRPLPGWNPQPGTGKVLHPLVHFQHDNKDYLVVLNAQGTLYAFSKTGDKRFPPLALEDGLSGPPQVEAEGKNPRIVCFHRSGKAIVCNTAGERFSLSIGNRKTAARGVLTPLSGDGRFEYAVVQDSVVSAGGYSANAFKSLFRTALPAVPDTLFSAFGNRLGLVDTRSRRIWLLDHRGQVARGFPLAGATPFAITTRLSATGAEMLIVGLGASVYAYRME